MNAQKGRAPQGFTIVELIIVIVVIAILATISVVAYNGITERARTTAAAADLRTVNTQIDMYMGRNKNRLPTSLNDLSDGAALAGNVVYWPYDNNSAYCVSTEAEGTAYHALSSDRNDIKKGGCDEIGWVAGEPLGYVDTPGATEPLTSTVSGTPDITLYVVTRVIDNTANYGAISGLSPSGTDNRFNFQRSVSGGTGLGYRIDTPNYTNYTSYHLGTRVAGFHIGWLQAGDNATVRSYGYDQAAAYSSSPLDIGAGWNGFTSLYLASSTSTDEQFATVLYDEAHDETTRAKVMNWLAQKFNTGQSF